MKIKTADFVISNTDIKKCPKPDKPEYAFIGRSNVGKSSLINMLTNRTKLAKISGKPGKTQLINHFLINEKWYLVDLPGYGYAKTSKTTRQKFEKIINKYILQSPNLMSLFVLIDGSIPPQKNDINFINTLGINEIPFVIIVTKSDKVSKQKVKQNIEALKNELLKMWEELPKIIITSSKSGIGKDEILDYIDEVNKTVKNTKIN